MQDEWSSHKVHVAMDNAVVTEEIGIVFYVAMGLSGLLKLLINILQRKSAFQLLIVYYIGNRYCL